MAVGYISARIWQPGSEPGKQYFEMSTTEILLYSGYSRNPTKSKFHSPLSIENELEDKLKIIIKSPFCSVCYLEPL